MKIVIPGRTKHEERTVNLFDGCALTFRLTHHAGMPCSVAEVDVGHPQLALIVARAQQMSWLVIDQVEAPPTFPVAPSTTSGLNVVVLAAPTVTAPVVTAPVDEPPALAAIRARITSNGWRAEDLADLCLDPTNDEFGSRVNPFTGLSAFEMMSSSAPVGWGDAAGTRFPWELTGWRPPSDSWTPPPHRKQAPPEARQGEAAVELEPQESDITTAPPAAPVAPELTPLPTLTIPKVTGEHPAVLAGYGDVTTVERAVAVIASLITDGKRPAVAKASAQLRVAGLPICNATMLAHLSTGLI